MSDFGFVTSQSQENLGMHAAIQKSELISKNAEALSQEISQMLSQNMFLCEVTEENNDISLLDSIDVQTSNLQETDETQDIDFSNGILQGDSPTNGFEEGLDDNTPSDNDSYKKEYDENRGHNNKTVEKDNVGQDMYTALQKQAIEKKGFGEKGRSLDDNSFSVLLILIYNLNEWGFLPPAIDAEDVRGLQFTNGNDVFIEEATNINFQFVIDNINEINDCISFTKKIDEVKPEIRKAFNALWSLKPAGIGSRDMMEYHITLGKSLEQFPDWAAALLKSHHSLILDRKFAELSKICGKSIAEIKQALELLGQFNPYPSYFFRPDAGFCVPEIRIAPDSKTGKIKSEFTKEGSLKKFAFNRSYLDIVLPGSIIQNTEASKLFTLQNFIQNENEMAAVLQDIEKIQDFRYKKQAKDAYYFTSFISQRQQILKKTADFLIKEQKDFLESGNNFDLKPMNQKKLAIYLNVKAPEVSRLVNGKYVEILTSQGLLIKELSWFFADQDYETLLDQIIREEDRKAPHNDTKLRALLQDRFGISISQATTVRARKKLGYPSFEERKILD